MARQPRPEVELSAVEHDPRPVVLERPEAAGRVLQGLDDTG